MADTPMWSEDDFERRAKTLAAHIRRVWRLIASAISGSLQGKAFVTQSDVGEIPSQWNELVNDVVIGYVTNVYTAGVNDIVQLAGDVPSDVRIGDDLVDNHIREVRRRLRGIGDDVWQVARDEIAFGVRQGESVAEIAERVRNVTGVSTGRSLTIARTEVHAAYEAGAYDQAFFIDSDATKIWLATNDERTRPTHRAADGQRRRISDAFSVGGSELRYPGDPLGQPGESINCRCTTMYDFDIIPLVSDDETSDDGALSVTAAGKKFDSKKHPRGKDGRFIKKGAVLTALTKPKLSIGDALNAANEIDQKTWDNLTSEQQNKITTAVNKIPESSLFKKQLDNFNQIVKSGPDTDDDVDDAVSSYPPPPSPSTTPTVTSTPTNIGIPAHKGASFGTPTKASTALIWGKYPAGTIILDTIDGSEFIEWNGKKYVHSVNGEEVASWTKKDAYATLKNDIHWVVPEPTDVSMGDSDESNSPSVPDASTDLPDAPADVAAIPLSTPTPKAVGSLKGNPGDPVKVTTGVIWGKYDPNTTILSSVDGKDRIYWDGKKYQRQSVAPDGSWQTNATWTKKDAYAELKGDANWVVPPSKTLSSSLDLDDSSNATSDFVPGNKLSFKFFYTYLNSNKINGKILAVNKSENQKLAWSDDQNSYVIFSGDDVNTGSPISNISAIKKLKLFTGKWGIPADAVKPSDHLDYVAPPTQEEINGILYDASFGPIYGSDAKKLISVMTPELFAKLTPGQKTYLDEAYASSSFTLNDDDIAKWNSFKNATATSVTVPVSNSSSDVGTEISSSDIINMYTSGKFVPGSDVAISKNGDLKIVATDNGAQFATKQGSWVLGAKFEHASGLAEMFKVFPSEKWYKPAAVSGMPAGVSSAKLSDVDIMGLYNNQMFVPGKVVAISSDAKFKIIATHTGAILSAEQPDGSWSKESQFQYAAGIEQMLKLLKSSITWHKPLESDDNDNSVFSTSTNPLPPTPASPLSPSSSPILPPIATVPGANLPWYVKQSIKNSVKTDGVGHFSAATKIWDSIVKIQQQNIDIGTGQSKYTPLQILQVLDSYTKSSKSATPWQDKIKKWGGTNAGFYYMKNSGVPNVLSVATPTSGGSTTTPSVSTTTPSTSPSAMPTVSTDADGNVTVNDVPLGKSDISHLTSDQKDNIYAAFKNYSDTYLTSPENSILNAAKNVAQTYSLSPYQVLSIIDDAGAKKFSVTNTNPFVKKITDWLKTPQGAAKALGKPIPKPPRPDYSPGIDPNKLIPSFEESSSYPYYELSTYNATSWFAEITDKYGEYTPSQVKGLKHYTGGSYISINNYLRGHETSIAPTNMSTIKQAQAGMRPSIMPVLLKRGQGYNGIGNASSHEDLLKMVGQTWRNEGFTSTSVGSTPAFGGPVLLEIEAPPGTPMAWVDPISMHKGEEEMILGAGLDFKIISVVKSGYKSVVRVRVVPNPEAGE